MYLSLSLSIYIYIKYIFTYVYMCMCMCVCIYIYIYISSKGEWAGSGENVCLGLRAGEPIWRRSGCRPGLGRGDDTVGNPRRARISRFEPLELIISLKLDKWFPVQQLEATVSQSRVPSSPLMVPLRRASTTRGSLAAGTERIARTPPLIALIVSRT